MDGHSPRMAAATWFLGFNRLFKAGSMDMSPMMLSARHQNARKEKGLAKWAAFEQIPLTRGPNSGPSEEPRALKKKSEKDRLAPGVSKWLSSKSLA
ncbi:UNVERIFIED_CONTAM: hypothetical protein K2H54_043403 [Gekko kuhli]